MGHGNLVPWHSQWLALLATVVVALAGAGKAPCSGGGLEIEMHPFGGRLNLCAHFPALGGLG